MAQTCKTLTVEKAVTEPKIEVIDFGFADTSTSQSGFIYNDACQIDYNNYEGKNEGVGVVLNLIELGDKMNIDKFEIQTEYDRPDGEHVSLSTTWFNGQPGEYTVFVANTQNTWMEGEYKNLNVSVKKVGTVF